MELFARTAPDHTSIDRCNVLKMRVSLLFADRSYTSNGVTLILVFSIFRLC